VHTFPIVMDNRILVGGEVVQARKSDGLEGLTYWHCRMENDLVREDRPVLFAGNERIAPLGLGLRAVADCRLGSDPPRQADHIDRVTVFDLDLEVMERLKDRTSAVRFARWLARERGDEHSVLVTDEARRGEMVWPERAWLESGAIAS